ncbi:hypothetical protein BAE44_0017467 [Dichanthelium oligosanthes]|uniref:Uncharacterized protein n=1 Tax=Dichanthelium oligosanthes TaxID=888268 RepID=A0A1E5V914_9POAL|nr:hypothetical protein BAE44_0017467 [Dichanthelium oligosanthes]
MKLIVCLCICFLLVASSSLVPVSDDRCPVQCRPPEDATAMVVGQAQASASSMTTTAAAADHPQEVFESSKRLSPGGPNPQHH